MLTISLVANNVMGDRLNMTGRYRSELTSRLPRAAPCETSAPAWRFPSFDLDVGVLARCTGLAPLDRKRAVHNRTFFADDNRSKPKVKDEELRKKARALLDERSYAPSLGDKEKRRWQKLAAAFLDADAKLKPIHATEGEAHSLSSSRRGIV